MGAWGDRKSVVIETMTRSVIIADDTGSFEIHPDGSVSEKTSHGTFTWGSANTMAIDLRSDQGLTPLQSRFCDYVLGPDPISAAVREFVRASDSFESGRNCMSRLGIELQKAEQRFERLRTALDSAWSKLTDEEKNAHPL